MINYWQPGYEWMGHGLQGHWCPSFAHYQLQSPDVSGLGNHGQLFSFANNGNNALVTSDGKGALDLNGLNNYVMCNGVDFVANTSMTISVWGFIRSTAGYRTILSRRGVTTNYELSLNTGDTKFGFFSGVGFTPSTSNVGLNTWAHLVVSVSPSGTSYFLNGSPDGTSTDKIGTPTAADSLWIGQVSAGGGTQRFDGRLDDIRLYRRALPAGEVLATYQAGRGGGMGYQPPLRRSYAALLAALVLACDTGNYSLSGQSAGLFAARSLAADQAQYILSGNAANTLASRLLSSDPATYAATGNDAATLCARLLDGGAAAYALTGTDAGLIANRKLTADQAICFLAGNNAELLRTLKLNAGSMQLQLDNFAASLLAGRKISADGAQYLLVVSDANLTSSASGVAPYYYLFMMRGPQ